MAKVEAVIAAAKQGDAGRVSSLIDEDPGLATAATMAGSQPIHAAYLSGHQPVVELLLARGVSLDVGLAAELGMLGRVEPAVRADPQLVQAFGPAGSTVGGAAGSTSTGAAGSTVSGAAGDASNGTTLSSGGAGNTSGNLAAGKASRTSIAGSTSATTATTSSGADSSVCHRGCDSSCRLMSNLTPGGATRFRV